MKESWHDKEVSEVKNAFNVGQDGLSEREAEIRLKKYGKNELIEKKKTTALEIFLNQFKDIFVLVLLAAIALSVMIGWYKGAATGNDGIFSQYGDAAIIAAIVVLNAAVGFVQEYRAEEAIAAMKKLAAPQSRVLREGKEKIIPAGEVVPGDIICLEAGDRIPADARLTEVSELKTDEAVLTGESLPVNKVTKVISKIRPVADKQNTVFMGTYVSYGKGKAVVTATGMDTEFGNIAGMLQKIEEKETPLKLKLDIFAKKIAKVILAVIAIIFALGIIRGPSLANIMDSFMTAIALAVAAVPEGLPAVVTISLALGAKELAKRKAIVRRLSSAETLGAVTVICSDKTGTLTRGEMAVNKIYVDDKILELTDGCRTLLTDAKDLSWVLKSAALCNNARYQKGKKAILGDTTEGALIAAAQNLGLEKELLEKEYPRIRELTFSSERKMMTTVHRSVQGTLVAFSKGAPEAILDKCTLILSNGKKNELSPAKKEQILKVNEEIADQALRMLAIAFRELSDGRSDEISSEELENNLVFLGLIGMSDPPRQEAKEAIKKCKRAGIKPVMITGDHKTTALAIAKELGMFEGSVITGPELESLSDEGFEEIAENISVYARVSPEHKLRIVKALKKKGHIVAMTGDGVNDAPALKQADIGVAMGITGTDVTKEAADLILADDNFATIVGAIEGGRTIYDNIRKFSFFLLSCNFAELFIVGTFAISGLEIPLTAAMILWINLITDGAPAVALSMDPPDKDVMNRTPRNPNKNILYGLLAPILAIAATQFIGTAGLFYFCYYVLAKPLAEARTIAFVQIALQELVVVWNCRSETRNAFKVGFSSNKPLLLSVIISIIITAAIPYTGLLGTIPLTLFDWMMVIPMSLSGLLIMPEIFYGRKIWRWI